MFTILLILSVTFAISYILWKCTYWQRHGIKGPRAYPLVGNMLQYITAQQHFGDVYQKIYNEYSDLSYIGIYRLFNEPCILLRSPEMLKEVMIRSFQHFQDNVLWVDPKRDEVVYCNPFIAKGEKWRNMRNEIVPIFTPNKVKSSYPHILNVCEKLNTYVKENMNTNCFEAKDLFSKYTLDVVASAAYGLDAQSFTNTNSDFTHLVENLFLPNPLSLLETTALLFSPTLGELMKFTYVPADVTKWLKTIITNVLNLRLDNDKKPTKDQKKTDFIQWLIENKQKLNEPVDRETIVGHCGTFLLEGFETSSSLMAFALYEYAINPLEQRKVIAEIDEVLKRYEGKVCHEALQEMTYFEASLYETLRLHPPMMALLKHCTKSFTLSPQTKKDGKSFKVPEGMVVIVPVKAVHYKTTKLTAAERARRYREKIKLDKARNEVYKKKKKESNEKRMKRGDMPKKMLQRERAKNREYVRAMKLKKVAERQMTDTLSSTITQAHGLPEFKSNENEELPAIPTKFNENTSENKRLKSDPDLYPDPLSFKPERFLVDKEKRPSCSFLGFGEGPRMCPGGRFGLAQTKAGLVTLLSQYSVYLADKAKEKPFKLSTTTFLTATKNGIWISFKPRI